MVNLTPHRDSSVIRIATWLFPIAVWALATLLLKGDLGRWNDDYAFSQRIPETNTYQQLHPYMWGVFTLSQQIWRPLFFIIIPSLQTALWDAPWINHTLHAVLHLGLCALLWKFLLRLNISRRSAAAVTLVYMTFPVHFQTLFWSACLTTVLATGIYVLLGLMYLRYAALPPGRMCSRGRLLAWTFGITAVGTLIPLMNEQPAAAVIALPFLHPAFQFHRDPRRGSRIRDLMRAWLPIAALLVMYAGYLFLYVTTSTKGYPATAGTFIDLHPRMFFARIPSFISEMWRCLTIQGHWDELFKDGVRALKSLGTQGVVWAAVVVTTGVLWAWAWFTRPACPVERDGPGSAERRDAPLRFTLGQVVAFGLMLFCSAWGVIYVLKVYQPEPRLFFMPLIGVAAILGKLADMLLARLVRAGSLGDTVARLSGAVIVPVVIGGAVILAGTQRLYHEVFYRDEDIGTQLRNLVPEFQRAAFFLPVRVEDPRYRVGEDWFNRQFHQIFLSSYNLNSWIKQQLRNSRSYCGTYNTLRTEYKLVDERMLGWQWWFVPEGTPWIEGSPWHTYGVWQIPWEKMIPFKIDTNGKVTLITEVSVQRVDNADASVRFPLVEEIAKSRAVPEAVATYFNPVGDGRVRSVAPWKSATGIVLPIFRRFDWDIEYSVARLATSGPGASDESRMFALLPPSERPCKVYFRVSVGREDVAREQPAVRVSWSLGNASMPTTELTLSPETMRLQKRWIPVTLQVPAHAEAMVLQVTATSVEAKPSDTKSVVFVTEGYWESVAIGAP